MGDLCQPVTVAGISKTIRPEFRHYGASGRPGEAHRMNRPGYTFYFVGSNYMKEIDHFGEAGMRKRVGTYGTENGGVKGQANSNKKPFTSQFYSFAPHWVTI